MTVYHTKYTTIVITLALSAGVLLFSCFEKPKSQWNFKEVVELKGIAPVGIAIDGNYIWLSDPDHKRVVKTDLRGNILEEITRLERPMHITLSERKLYVPEYLNDSIRVIDGGKDTYLRIKTKLDAPAGVAVGDGTVAIADFYNHRVLLIEDDNELSLGSEGHGPGELYYPTDVEIYQDLIYVADAYNNRVQVFNKSGASVQIIGTNDHIQVASGISVATNEIYISDFDGNRILIYSKNGVLLQELKLGMANPSDIAYNDHQILIANYGNSSIAIFEKNAE
jgi:DNA-binding beta-propeller fold protein YncE